MFCRIFKFKPQILIVLRTLRKSTNANNDLRIFAPLFMADMLVISILSLSHARHELSVGWVCTLALVLPHMHRK